MTDLWQRATSILESLMQIKYSGPIPPWKHIPSPVIIKKVEYDHWNQKIIISEPEPIIMPPPAIRIGYDYNDVSMRKAFPGIVIGAQPPIFQPNEAGRLVLSNRGSCDFCYLVSPSKNGKVTDVEQ